jgi:hypothetical protein
MSAHYYNWLREHYSGAELIEKHDHYIQSGEVCEEFANDKDYLVAIACTQQARLSHIIHSEWIDKQLFLLNHNLPCQWNLTKDQLDLLVT